MRIDNKTLNLVIPLETANGVFHIYSTPISREVFETYFLVIAKTFATIYQEGLNLLGGPAVASIMLKKIAENMNMWDGPTGVEVGLIGEIRRITMVAVPDAGGGWSTLPLQTVLDKELIDMDDFREVEGAITFFICASAMHRRSLAAEVIGSMASLLGALTDSSSFTAYLDLLRTSTATETLKQTAGDSLVPS